MEHQQLENHKEQQLFNIYTQFKQWVNNINFNGNNNGQQSQQININAIAANQIIQQNQIGNIVIITPNNNIVMNAIIVPNQQNQQNQNQHSYQIKRPSNIPRLKSSIM